MDLVSMRVYPNSDTSAVTGIPNRPAARPALLGQDKTSLAAAEQLDKALAQTPEVRAEKVAEAQKLVRDVSYPPEELINKLSALLASHLDAADKSE